MLRLGKTRLTPPTPPANSTPNSPGSTTPDGRTRQGPPRRGLRRCHPPRRPRLGGAQPRHALRRLRHRRHPGHPSPGQGHHRRAVHRARRGPRPPPVTQDDEGGKGPSPSLQWTSARQSRSKRSHEAAFPTTILTTGPRTGQAANHLTRQRPAATVPTPASSTGPTPRAGPNTRRRFATALCRPNIHESKRPARTPVRHANTLANGSGAIRCGCQQSGPGC